MKVSIITVTLNSEETVEKTILSVINQNYQDLEYIIIDGKSSDKTLEIIKKYQNKIDILISEKDTGIYDAMNKGVSKASGEIVYFLNADDELFDEYVISEIVKEIETKTEFDYFYGGVISRNIFGGKSENIRMQKISNMAIKLGRNIPHQSLFVRRYLFEKLGLFDLRYKINADYEWECRLVKKGYRGLFLKRIISYYNQTGFSSRISWNPYKERFAIIFNYFGVFYFLSFFLYSIFKFPVILLLSRMKLTRFISRCINKLRGSTLKK